MDSLAKRAKQILGHAPPPPIKQRCLSEQIVDEKGAKDWPNVNKAYYKSIGLRYKSEHENPFRFQYSDCLWYQARTLREREIILAEDEKNPVSFVGTEEEKSLDESAFILTDTIGTHTPHAWTCFNDLSWTDCVAEAPPALHAWP